MFVCKPERNVNKVRALVAVCALVTAILFLVSTRFGGYAYSSLIRLSAFISLMVSILLVVRYALTEYEYILEGGDFSVVKITGNKRQTVCCVAVETAIGLYTKAEYKALPSAERAIIKYTLNQNMSAESHVFLCDFNGKRAMIEFEPNSAFVSIFKDEISRLKKDSSAD